MNKDQKIFVAGAFGMVGSALVRSFQRHGCVNLLTPKKSEVDLTEQTQVRSFLQNNKPEIVVVAAAKVGGILANKTYPAEFIYQNLMIAGHLIHEAHQANVKRLLFLGSTCIYPRMAMQPISEEALLTGPLEETNEAYAIAKIAGVKLCQFYRTQYGRDYISALPTNLYGPNDTYHRENAHVIPALIRRFHEAKINNQKEVVIWGTGTPKREFLYVDDLAEACLFLLMHYHDAQTINIGTREEFTIKQVAEKIATTIGFQGKIVSDPAMPDGTPRKKTDTSRIFSLGWRPKIAFEEGLKLSYADFLNGYKK